MVNTPKKKSRILVNIIPTLALLILIGCIVVAGCNSSTKTNTTPSSSSTPTITPSGTTKTPAVTQSPVPNRTATSNVTVKGWVNISIGDYHAEPPATVFVDNVSVGNVSTGNPLNLTVGTGRHSMKVCIIGACLQQDVVVTVSDPVMLDFSEQLKNEIVTGPLTVSIGGYIAELPVFVDNTSVGNVSNNKPLNMKVAEGNHTVKVCVGMLCENETVSIKFAQPMYIDFGKRLKDVMEFSIPTIRIIDTQKNNNRVMVTVEFINPTNKDLSMSATVRVAYSYIAPSTRYREGNAVESTLTRTVKASNRTVQSVNLTLTGGSSYISEIPTILESSLG